MYLTPTLGRPAHLRTPRPPTPVRSPRNDEANVPPPRGIVKLDRGEMWRRWAWHGVAGEVRKVPARCGLAGQAGQGNAGVSWSGWERHGVAGGVTLVRHGKVRQVWLGSVVHDLARLGRLGPAWRGAS